MRDYDPREPLIFIHIPKTAGTSCRELFREWYGADLLLHYYNEAQGKPPPRHEISCAKENDRGKVVYGHFNRNRGFGVEHYYPEVSQFVTIIRDPFDRAVSTYFYLRKAAEGYKDKSRIPSVDLATYLESLDPRMTMLDYFPRQVSADNYKEIIEQYFIEVGLFDHLQESLRRIGENLGKGGDTLCIPMHNVSVRDQEVPERLREIFREKRPLEYAVFDYIKHSYRM